MTKPPTPVDVSSDDLRSGRFQMNPRPRRWAVNVWSWLLGAIGYGAGYFCGRFAHASYPALHQSNPILNFLAVAAFVVVASFIVFGGYARLTRGRMPDTFGYGVVMLFVAFASKAFEWP